MNDSELLHQYVSAQSEAAFAALVQKNLGMVYGVALRRTRDPELAKEVALKVFSALASKAQALAARPVLASWLYRSAQYAASEAVRNEARRRNRLEKIIALSESTENTPDPNWEKIHPILDEAVGRLPHRDRDAIVLRFMDEYSYAEIGTRLRLTENAARMRVERALEKLRAMLARRGVDSTAGAVALALTSELHAAAPAGLAAAISAGALSNAAPLAAGAGTLALLKFMSAAKVASVLGVVAATAVGTAIYEARDARAAQAALVRVEKERDALRTQARAQRVVDVPRKPAVAEAPAQPAIDRVNGARTPAAIAASVAAAPRKIDPARLADVRQRFELDSFIRQRGLTPEQADKLGEILGEWDDVRNDFQASIRAQGLVWTPEAQKLRDQLQHQIEVEPLIALLGQGGDRAYFDFESSSFYRAILDPVAAQLASIDSPLNADQTTQLLALIRKNQRLIKPDPTSMGSEIVIDWAAVATDASGFLTPAQVNAINAHAARHAGTKS